MRAWSEIIVDDHTVRRIPADRFLGRERRIRILVAPESISRARLKKDCSNSCARRCHAWLNSIWRRKLPDRSHIVENPETTTVRSNNNVVVVNDEITNGSRRHVEPQRLPVVAVIEGDVYCALSAG